MATRINNTVQKGAYILVLHVHKRISIQVGHLGRFTFPPGYYSYTGSALSGIEARLRRHQSQEKRLHWHIDYFLQDSKIVDVKKFLTTVKLECRINALLLSSKEARIVARGFGSSDCRCRSHLIYWGKKKPPASVFVKIEQSLESPI